MKKEAQLGLSFQLPIGLNMSGQVDKDVELLRSNGHAEKVFTSKSSNRPYTWYGNVISIATKSIGDYQIGHAVREEYSKEESITIPPAVKSLYFADANTMIVEIHRRVWQNLIPDQKISCIFCNKNRLMDIDLNRIELSAEEKKFIEETPDFGTIVIDLQDGFYFNAPMKKAGETGPYDAFDGLLVNRLIYRTPTLGDAIKNEDVVEDSIQFWRQIAFDCLIAMYAVNPEDETDVTEIPRDCNALLGMRLYNTELTSRDLRDIREALRETVPTLPFAYEEECGCPQQKIIPVVMEASSFFSE